MDDVRVYNKALFNDLMAASSPIEQAGKQTPKKKKKSLKERENERAAIRHQRAIDQLDRRNAEEQQRTRERFENAMAKREAEFERQFEALREGNKFVDSIDKFLSMTEQSAKQKTEKLHMEWESEVFANVQKAVANNLQSVNRSELNKLKREEFQKFLQQANGKTGGVLFLDSTNEHDEVPAIRTNQARIGKLNDPSRRVLDKALEEQMLFEGLTIQRKTGKEEPKERDVLDITQWASGKIEATPHGHFSKMMTGKPHKEGSKSAHINDSNVNFDHYEIYQGKVKEFKGSKKIIEGKVNNHAPLWSNAWANDSPANKVVGKIGRLAPPMQRPEAAVVAAQPVCGRSNQQNQHGR